MMGDKMKKKRINDEKLKIVVISLLFFIFLNLAIVMAVDGVYFYQPDEGGVLKPVLQSFNANGEIDIGDEVKRAYLNAEGNNPKNSLGYLKNVKIKKDGDNFVVEFKDNGKATRFDSEGKSYDYNNIKASGKLVADSNGKLVKADFETTQKGNYYLNDFMYEVPAETKFNLDNKILGLKLVKGGEFSSFKESDKKKTYKNIKNNGEFRINDRGELVFARFEVSAETELSLKGYKYKLAANSKVNFENNRVDIVVPDGTKLSAPEKISGETADPGLIFSFSTESGGIILPSGDIIENKNGKTVVNYKDGFYISDKNYVLKTSDGKEDLLINTNGKETYLYFEGNPVDDKKSYVFIGRDKIITNSVSGEGASLFILPGNRLGIKTTSDNTIAVESKNGKVIVERPLGDNPPSIKLSGESIVTLDKRSFYGQGSELYFDPRKVLAGDFNNGRFSASAKLSFVDNNEKNLKNFDVYSNDKDQYAAVSEKDMKSPFKYYKTKLGFYVSSSLTFNQLSYDAQKFYDSLELKKQQEIASYTGGMTKGERSGAADLQVLIKKLIDEEIRIRQNPVKASVRLYGGGYGGSGTVVGVDKEGYPIILTAGHVVSQQGLQMTIEFADGKSYQGRVLGGIDSLPEDIALIKLDTKVPNIAYVPVPSAEKEKELRTGTVVTRIGTPNLGNFQYTQTKISQVSQGGRISTYGQNDQIYQGQSGGGIFYNGRMYGICSRCDSFGGPAGSFTSPSIMRSFLNKYGYGYLISVSAVFKSILI